MKAFPAILLLCTALAGCSTTRILAPGQNRLERNEIEVVNPDPDFDASELNAYIRQDAGGRGIFGWKPFMSVYNWSRRDGIWHKIGTAPVVYDEAAVGTSVSNMRTRLEYLGYYGSKVDTTVTIRRRKARVNYEVTLGKRYMIDSLQFEAPAYEPFAEEFREGAADAEGRLKGMYLSEALLEQETAVAASRMRNLGYFGITTDNYSFEADTLGGNARLIYRVLEHSRHDSPDAAAPLRKFTIGKVSIKRPADISFRNRVLLGLNTVHPGDIYSERSVANTYSRLSALKVFSSVGIEMRQAGEDKVDCNINLTSSRVQGFKVNLEGSTNSTGLVGISPRINYFHKNIFHGGEWLNLGFNGDFQFMVSDNARATEYGVSAGLSLPRFLGLPYSAFRGAAIPRTEINLAYSNQDRPEYTRRIFSTAFGYSGITRSNVSYQIYPLQVNFVRLYNLDQQFSATLARNPYMRYAYQDHLDAGIGAVLYYNSSPDIIPQSSYRFHKLTVDLSGNVLSLFRSAMKTNADGSACIGGSPFAQYVRGEYSWGITRSLDPDDIKKVATRFLIGGGYAYGNSSALPFEKQFYAGGASSMRGWQARALGPGDSPMDDTFIIPSQTGDIKLEFNIEYRFKLFWKLEGALFGDLGNVWNVQADGFKLNNLYGDVAADWGTGLRVNLNFILLRVDWGIKLLDPSLPAGKRLIGAADWLHRGGNALHFGIGYPF